MSNSSIGWDVSHWLKLYDRAREAYEYEEKARKCMYDRKNDSFALLDLTLGGMG